MSGAGLHHDAFPGQRCTERWGWERPSPPDSESFPAVERGRGLCRGLGQAAPAPGPQEQAGCGERWDAPAEMWGGEAGRCGRWGARVLLRGAALTISSGREGNALM